MTERRATYTTNRPTEHDHQALLFQWSAWQAKTIPELELLFAIPNGASVHKQKNSRGQWYSVEGQKLNRDTRFGIGARQ